MNTEQFVTRTGEGRRSETVVVPRPLVCILKGSSNLAECTCSDDIRSVAAWIRSTYKGSRGLVRLIATEPARARTAETILGSYATTSKKLTKLLDRVGDTDVMRLSALREALTHLAHSDQFSGRVARILESQERTFDPKLDSKLAVA